ncbi:hypothetical protein ACJMK2_040277, partial [Sinanodonta woodiana]
MDRTLFSFGDFGSFQFRTREQTTTLMLVKFLGQIEELKDSIEFRLYRGNLQVVASFNE